MKKYRIEILSGVLIIMVILGLYFGVNYLKKNNVLSNSYKLYCVFSNTTGVSTSNPVKVNGFEVGHISKMTLINDGSNKIKVEITISNTHVHISEDAEIRTDNALLGQKSLEISNGESTQKIQPNSTLKTFESPDFQEVVQRLVTPVIAKTEIALENISQISTNANKSINKLQKILITTHNAIKTNQSEIHPTLVAIRKMVLNLEQNGHRITNISKNLDSLSHKVLELEIDSMQNSIKRVLSNLESISEKVDNSENSTISKLLNEDSLYTNISTSVENLNLLLEDMRLNPGRYFSIRKKRDSYAPK